MTGAPALITFASSPLLVVVRSVTRAAMPMPATIVAQISATATTLRWVIRSAVKRELLFMTLIPGEFSFFHFVAPLNQVQRACGSRRESWGTEGSESARASGHEAEMEVYADACVTT